MKKPNFVPSLKFALMLGTASIMMISDAYAQSRLPAQVSAGIEGDYARMTFAWPERVRFSTKSSGNRLTLTFDKPTDASMGAILQQLSPVVTKAEKSKDGRSFIFTLNKSYKTRTFMSGNTAGVDLIGVSKQVLQSAKAKQTQPIIESDDSQEDEANSKRTQQVEKAAREAKKQSEAKRKEQIAKQKKVKEDAAKKQAIAAAKEQEKRLELKKAEDNKKQGSVVEPSKKIVPPAAVAAPVASPAAAATVAAVTPPRVNEAQKTIIEPEVKTTNSAVKPENIVKLEPVKPAITPSAEIPVQAPVSTPPAVVKADSVKPVSAPVVDAAPDLPFIRFPMAERTAAAVFSRQNILWAVFNKPITFDLPALTKTLPDALASVEQLPDAAAPGFTVLRFAQKAPVFPVVSKEAGSLDWRLSFANRPTRPSDRIRVGLSTEPPLKPHVLLPVLESADPVSIIDPIVGDVIQVTTVYKAGSGLTPQRDFVEFTLLATAQGVAVIPYSDTTRTAPQRSGLKITTADGVSLSADLPRLAMDELPDNAITGDSTLFPYAQWKLKNPNDFLKEQKRLLLQAAQGTGDNANFARLKLLQLFLSEGLFTEALGVADEIRNRDSNFYTAEKVSALRGATNFMMYRLSDASLDFASPELADIAEIGLWQNVLGELLGDTSKTFDFLAYNDSFISKYPPAFRQRLAIVAGDLTINRKEYNTAIKIFDTLSKDKIIKPIQGYVDFMIGKVSSETGQVDVAIQLWQGLAKNLSDRFLRARAEFSLVNLQLQQGKIDRAEAIKRLDRLRIVWRGDGLELNVLLLLGNLYMDDKQYSEAMRTYRDVVTYFPNVPEALPTAQKMAETFRFLYNEGGADTMEPLKALALFYEFRELTPLEAEGDRMIRNLADRLVGVDLLDRAAALLDHQVRFRLQKQERSRVGARLALIYLLNRQAKEALYTLELTGYGQNPIDLQRTRNQLAAAALTAQGEHEKALAVLDGDQTTNGLRAALNVYWDKKDWKNMVPVAESILSSRNDPSQPLNDDETDALLKLATAYAFERDASQLKYLSDYFTPLMKNNLQEKTFRFITNGSDPVDVKNIAQLSQEMSNIQDYLSAYRSKVAKGGVSSVVQ